MREWRRRADALRRRVVDADDSLHIQRRATVFGEPGLRADLVEDALGRLEHGVKVVIGDEFGPAEAQDIRMHAAHRQRHAKLVGPARGFIERLGGRGREQLAGRIDGQAAEGKRKIHVRAHRLEAVRLLGVAPRLQRPPHELQDGTAILAVVPRAPSPCALAILPPILELAFAGLQRDLIVAAEV